MSRDADRDYWLLFDDDCGFCRRWCDWARRRGADAVVRFEPCRSAVEHRAQAGLSESDCGHAAFLLEIEDGRVRRTRRAAGAINALLRMLPGPRNALYRLAGRLYLVPGIRQLEEIGYRWIARHRHRLGPASCDR